MVVVTRALLWMAVEMVLVMVVVVAVIYAASCLVSGGDLTVLFVAGEVFHIIVRIVVDDGAIVDILVVGTVVVGVVASDGQVN